MNTLILFAANPICCWTVAVRSGRQSAGMLGTDPGLEMENPASEWLSPGRFAMFLAIAIVASFPGVATGLTAFAHRDAGEFAYPVAFYFRESFWHGEFPTWNPLNSCGIPFMAQWNTMTLYPLSLFYLLLPAPWSFGVFCLGHLFLGGMGMYFLAQRWTGNRAAAALAGMAFAFNGMTLFGVMWPHLLAALGWMPWVMLAMERAWLDGGKFVILAAGAAGMQLLSGGVEVILQTWLILDVFWLACAMRHQAPFLKLLIRGVSSALLAAGLAMAQLLPFLQLLSNSQRTSGYAGTEFGKIAAMPPSGWANYLVPLFHCSPDFNGVFMQIGQGWTASYYLGVGVVAFALLAVWRVGDFRVWLLFALTLFGLIMALGPAGYLHDAVVRLVPVLGFMRFPVKFVFLPTFALPLMAAFGMGWLIDLPPAQWAKGWKAAMGIVLAVLGTIGGIVCLDNLHPVVRASSDPVPANACVRCLFLLAAVACLPFIRQTGKIHIQRLAQFGLLSLAWLDVLTHSPDLNPTVSASAWRPDATRQFFKWDTQLRAGTSRAMRSRHTFWKMLTSGSTEPNVDLDGRRLSLFMNLNLVDGIAKFDGFYALDLKEYLDVFKHVYFTTNDAPGLLDFLGISEIGNAKDIMAWDQRDTCRPLITVGPQSVFLDATNALNAIFAGNFDPSQKVILPAETRGIVRANRTTNATILTPRFSARRLDFEVQSDNAAMVVVAQTFYPAWHAYVDGTATPLWRANYAFQSLEVPAGRHQVSLVFEDRLFHLGGVISVMTLLVCVGSFFRLNQNTSRTQIDGPGVRLG